MIKFFRHIRKSLIQENNMGKYLTYAIGEILLVVIGILIALQINNWNQQSNNRIKEKEILQSIKTSLENDLNLYEKLFDPRFEKKRSGIEFLKNAAYYKTNPPSDTLRKYMGFMGTDVTMRYDKGPYDGLKSAGLELIENKELQKNIIHTYEVSLPALTLFINDYNKEKVPLKQEYIKDLIKSVVVKESDGTLDMQQVIKIDNLLEHPSFLNLLDLQENKLHNYNSRLEAIKFQITSLKTAIDKELKSDD